MGDFVIRDGVLVKYNGCDERIVIPEGVTKIGKCAFSDCKSLYEITIPDSVTEIEWFAFSGCKALCEITILGSVTVIELCVFGGCSNLCKITLPDSVTKIGEYAFSGCKSLCEITIPDRVTEIGDSAFFGCTNLCEITIPKGVKKIRKRAFKDCRKLCKITIPDSVTVIGAYAFNGCSDLIAHAPKLNDNLKKGGLTDKKIKLALAKGFVKMLADGTPIDSDTAKWHYDNIKKLKEILADLRTEIIKNNGLPTVEAIDIVIRSEFFSKDAEVTVILLSCRARLGGGKGALDDLEL